MKTANKGISQILAYRDGRNVLGNEEFASAVCQLCLCPNLNLLHDPSLLFMAIITFQLCEKMCHLKMRIGHFHVA